MRSAEPCAAPLSCWASEYRSPTTSTVKVTGTAPANALVQVFTVGAGGHQGETYLGAFTATAAGAFTGNVELPSGYALNRLTATATPPNTGTPVGTSEFTPDVAVTGTCSGGDLSVTKTASQTPRVDGDVVTWTVNVAWSGTTQNSAPITVTDTVGSGTFTSMSLTPASAGTVTGNVAELKAMTPGQAPVKITVTTKVAGYDGQLNKVVRKLLADRMIEYTIPEKPQSRHQKYRLTGQGRAALAKGPRGDAL